IDGMKLGRDRTGQVKNITGQSKCITLPGGILFREGYKHFDWS
ncbi:18007_t:CDS:2, partial [Racocetra persica]